MSDFEISHEESKNKGPKVWWRERSPAEKILYGFSFAVLGLGFMALCGWVLMLLWNWLMPDIFGLKQVTYWQAWGLLILSSILFKRVGPGHPHPTSDYKRRKKLKSYLNEEHFHQKDAAE